MHYWTPTPARALRLRGAQGWLCYNLMLFDTGHCTSLNAAAVIGMPQHWALHILECCCIHYNALTLGTAHPAAAIIGMPIPSVQSRRLEGQLQTQFFPSCKEWGFIAPLFPRAFAQHWDWPTLTIITNHSPSARVPPRFAFAGLPFTRFYSTPAARA
eukprot:scaffold31812_cov22-Tisochrysis_lutea.AAC.1